MKEFPMGFEGETLPGEERRPTMPAKTKQDYLNRPVEHIDITRYNVVPLVEAMRGMSYSARDLARAAEILDRMIQDKDCGIILCLAGSLMNAGLKKVVLFCF